MTARGGEFALKPLAQIAHKRTGLCAFMPVT